MMALAILHLIHIVNVDYMYIYYSNRLLLSNIQTKTPIDG